MMRTRAPFWAIDLVAILTTAGMVFAGKLDTQVFLVVLMAILGFGVSSRAPGNALQAPASDDSALPPPAPARASAPVLPPGAGGVASLLLGLAHMGKHIG